MVASLIGVLLDQGGFFDAVSRGVDASVGDPDGHGGTLRGLRDGRDDVAVGVLENGVATLQRREGRERLRPGALVADVVGGPVEAVRERTAGAREQVVELVGAGGEQVAGVGHRRARAHLGQPVLLARDALRDDLAEPVARPRDALDLLGHVGDDKLDRNADVDVVVVARGGGSIEDLLPFSDEALVRAVHRMRTPVVSAIGHEPDQPLLDLVADVRASTPTDAAKLVVPDMAEEVQGVTWARDRLRQVITQRIAREQDLSLIHI